MKKRIFGMLLMGAMVIASMSMFTSCKDYDDDINANKAEIASLKAALQEQKTSLEAAIAAAKSEAQTANATLNTKLTELQTLVGNNKTDLENAIKAAVTDSKAYADGIGADALKAAKEYADAAAKEAAATAKAEALEAASKDLADLKALMEAGDDAAAKKASELAAKIDAVDESVNKLIAAEKEERVNALLAVNTQIENIKLQIAALEKFQATITQQVADIAKDLESTKKILEGVKATAEKNAEDIKANKEAIAKNVSAIADLSDALAIVEGKVAGLEDQVVLLKKADAELGTKIDNLEEKLTALITKNATAISEIDAAYKAADAALKSEFQNLLKGYYTKAQVDELIKNFITSEALAPYAKTADVTDAIATALAAQKTAMETEIKKTLDAYDKALADALVALFNAPAENNAAGDIEEGIGMKDAAIKALEAIKAQNSGISQEVAEKLNVLKVDASKQLTSLVFRPEYYFDGIEGGLFYAVEDAWTKKFNGTDATNAKVNLRNAKGWASETYTKDDANKKISIYPDGIMAYHYNPTSANLEGWNIQFYNNVAKTRAAGTVNAPFAPKNAVLAENDFDENEPGIVYVRIANSKAIFAKAKANYKTTTVNQEPTIDWNANNGEITTIALQAIRSGENGDSVVTSDYALMKVEWYNSFVLADAVHTFTALTEPEIVNNKPIRGAHLYETSASALGLDVNGKPGQVAKNTQIAGVDYVTVGGANPAGNLYFDGTANSANKDQISRRHQFMYNADFDLNTLVETHFKYTEANVTSACVVDENVFKELGLSYKFTAVHYLVDPSDDKTDQFEHIHINADGTAFFTEVESDGKQKVDADGNPVKATNKGVVGRKPLIRVELMKDESILAVGYIMLEAVEEDPVEGIEEATVALDSLKYANCETPADWYVTWSMIENQVLYELGENGISAQTFYNRYNLTEVHTNATANAAATSIPVQYVKKADGTYVTAFDWNKSVFAGLASAKKDYAAASIAAAREKILTDFYNAGGVGYLNLANINVNVVNGKIAANATVDDVNMPTGWGEVKFTWNQPSAQTSVARWRLGDNDFWALAFKPGFVDPATGLSTEPLVTYVRLDNGNNSLNPLYIELNVAIGKLEFAHASLAENRIPNRWYASASETQGTAEIHANVFVPGTSWQGTAAAEKTYQAKINNGATSVTSVDKFEFDILSTFSNGKLTFGGFNAQHFPAFNGLVDAYIFEFNPAVYNVKSDIPTEGTSAYILANPKVEVTGASGASYALFIEPDNNGLGLTLKAILKTKVNNNWVYVTSANGANTQVVVKLMNHYTQPNVGNHYQIAQYQTGNDFTYARDILNLAGHTDLENTFKASVMVSFTDLNLCYDPFMNGENFFDIRFLRPVNISRGNKGTARDGVDNGSDNEVVKLVKIDDWRDYGMTYANTTNTTVPGQSNIQQWLYNPYYVVKIQYNLAAALSDENRELDANRVALETVAEIEAAAAKGATDQVAGLAVATTYNPNMVLTAKPAANPDAYGWYTLDLSDPTSNACAIKEVKADNKVTGYAWNTAAAGYYINYKNSQNTARVFNLYIPVRVSYFAGVTKETYAWIEVNGTVNNSRKK